MPTRPQTSPTTRRRVGSGRRGGRGAARARGPEVPGRYEWDREVAETATPARDAYALRLVVSRKLYDGGRIVAETRRVRSARARSGAADQPRTTSPRSASRAARRSRSPRRAARSSIPCSPTRGAGRRCGAALPRERCRPRAAHRRRRRGHRPAGGDAAVSSVLALDPLFDGGDITWSVFAVVVIKVVVAFVLLLVSVMLYIWGLRKVIADMQNRIGPEPGRSLRCAADPCRRHQVVLQGAVDPRRRPTAPCSGSRRTCRCCRRS